MNPIVIWGLVFPGIFSSSLGIYARLVKVKEYETKIIPLYEEEYRRYEEFFIEENFDDVK